MYEFSKWTKCFFHETYLSHNNVQTFFVISDLCPSRRRRFVVPRIEHVLQAQVADTVYLGIHHVLAVIRAVGDQAVGGAFTPITQYTVHVRMSKRKYCKAAFVDTFTLMLALPVVTAP